MTDFEIIQKCLNGETEYFEEIVKRYKNLVYSIVVKMNQIDEAGDLSQEIFIKIYNNLHKYSDEYKLSTWIMKLSTNHVIDYKRKKRMELVSFSEEYIKPSHNSPESEYLKKEANRNIVNAISELPDIYKEPMLLYCDKNLSYQEIADFIKIPLSKVKNRIFRARKILKEAISIEN